MRQILLAVFVLALGGQARAEVVAWKSPLVVDPDRGNFWREIAEPHKAEVAQIVLKARTAINQADNIYMVDYDPTGEGRLRIYRELEGMLRYARRLAPDNLDVLRMLGSAAEILGKTREALDAFHAAVDVAGADKVGFEVTGRLGEIYLRLGKLDDAIRYLRLAQGPIVQGQPTSANVLVHLATALAARGQTGDAIDVLAQALPASPASYSNEAQIVAFALAVQYDRDEQHGAAFEILDHLNTVLQSQLAATVQSSLGLVHFTPAEDQAYYLGLLYEAGGSFAEARSEWAIYAASGDLPYRQRALDHIAAIDVIRKTAPALPPPATARPHRHRLQHVGVP